MSIDAREKLLEVAARVYAESGYDGTTTRRIAQEAALNEVTLFRHFGSKDALLRAAIEHADQQARQLLNPDADDPFAELDRWALATFQRFYAQRNLIRQVMGDMVQRPAIAPRICDDTTHEVDQVVTFMTRQVERSLLPPTEPSMRAAAAAMLVHSLLGNALWRDLVPDIPPPDVCARLFVEVMLRALGARASAVLAEGTRS